MPTLSVFLLGLLLGPFSSSTPANERIESSAQCSPEAQKALDAGELETARAAFLRGVDAAQRAGRSQASCDFFLGLVAQRQAQSDKGGRRRQHLQEAAQWYEKALPDHRGALSLIANLAQVYADLGERERAGKLYEEALPRNTGDARAALTRSYAQFLSEEDWKRAAKLYRETLAAMPADDAAWADLLTLLQKNDPGQFAEAVWDAVEASQVDTAQRAALSALTSVHFQEEARIDILAALVAGLAEQQYSRESFADSAVAKALRSLETDPTLGPGIRQVALAHQKSLPEAESFGWWAEKRGRDRHTPLRAFRALLLSLASRVDPADPQAARVYLETADQLSPEFDPQLARALVANYYATGDREKIARSERRWEPQRQEAVQRLSAQEMAIYETTMEAIRLRDKRGPSGGEGGGGGVPRLAYDGGTGRCLAAPFEPCQSHNHYLRLEVPDTMVPHGLPAGGTRMALLDVFCTGRHLAGYRPLPQDSRQRAQMRLANFTPSFTAQGFSQPSTPSSASRCRRVPLTLQPAWLSSAAWAQRSLLLAADSLRGQLLRYGEDGVFQEAVPPAIPAEEVAYLRVQPSPGGSVVAEDGQGYLVWKSNASGVKRTVKLLGRTGAEGKLVSVFQWALIGKNEALAVANLLRSDGVLTCAIVHLSLSGEGYEVLHKIAADKPTSILYRVGIPVLTGRGEDGYFLAIEDDPVVLYRVTPSGKPERMATFPGLTPVLREELAHRQAMEATPNLFRLLERASLPAGLYGAGDDLFLLSRSAGEDKRPPSWVLQKLDSQTGKSLRTILLPTTAHHLTVAPGESYWAFFEKDSVAAIGRQAVPSLLLVPTAWLNRSSQDKPICD